MFIMAKRLKLKTRFIMLCAFVIAAGMGSCKKDGAFTDRLDAGTLVAGRLDGTWANPTQIEVPKNVSPGVFGSMRLVFTTDDEGNPLKFIAKDCPVVFSSKASDWSVSGTEERAQVVLTDVSPVDELSVQVSSTSLTISFYMGWENTDTGETGEGNFSATLTRQ